MKLLMFVPTSGRGGVSLVIRKVFQGLADYAPKDWNFEVLGQAYNEILEPVVYPENWKFTQIDPVEKLPPHPHQFRFLWDNVECFYDHLVRVAGDYDLIYCPSVFWCIRSREWDIRTPFVAHIPDIAYDEIPMGQLLEQHFRVATQLVRKRANFTIFLSEYWRKHATGVYGFDEDKTTVIPNSADFVAENYDPSPQEALRVREKYGLPEHYVLAFHPLWHKSPATILWAQRHARSISPLVPPLVMAGIGTEHLLTDAPVDRHITEVRKVLAEIGVQPDVDFFSLGRVPEEDIAGLYAGATVSVNASQMEGDLSGNTFNAFMAHCPHIYSDLPVYTMRIGREKYGYSFMTGEYIALAQRLIDVCADRDEARRRAVAAYGYAVSRTVKDVANEYIDVFSRVLHGR